MNITEQLEVSVNGERVALLDVKPSMSETDQQNGQNSLELKTPPIHISAGPQRLTVAFIQRLDGPVDDLIAPLENTLADVDISFGVTALPHLRRLAHAPKHTFLRINREWGASSRRAAASAARRSHRTRC